MRKFTFNLQALLTVREWETQKAQQQLGEANLQVAQLARRLEEARSGKARLLAQWGSGAGTRFAAQDRIQLAAVATSMERDLADLQRQLDAAQQQRLAAMETLNETTRSKRVVENLRERRFEEYRAAAYRQELAEIEDVINARRSATSGL